MHFLYKSDIKEKRIHWAIIIFRAMSFKKAICRVGSFSEFITMIIRLVGVRSLSTTAACAKVRIQEIRIFDEFLAHNKRQGAQRGQTSLKVYRSLVMNVRRNIPYFLFFYVSRYV
jgi:hypothetical protein